MKDNMQGWVPAYQLSNKCLTCKYVLRQGRYINASEMASCEWGNEAFPGAKHCLRNEPEDMDE